MIAYQYFHLPNGYVAKTSDNNPSELSVFESIRLSISSTQYYAYYVISNKGYVLASKLDENKNQFIRGRQAMMNELTMLPLSLGELIPDMRLMRQDMTLVARMFMVAPFTFKTYSHDKLAFAKAFDSIVLKKDAILIFNNMEDATYTLKTILSLLPIDFAKTISFVISDQLNLNPIEIVSPYGEKTMGECHLHLVTRNLTEEEKRDHNVIDFANPSNQNKELSSLAEEVYQSDLTPTSLLNLKNHFSTFIDSNGINEAVLYASKRENEFAQNKNVETLNSLLEIVNQVPYELASSILSRLANTFVHDLQEGSLSEELFNQIPNLSNQFPPFGEIVNPSYRDYLQSHYLSLEGQAEDDFAMILGTGDNFDSFFNELFMESNNRRKAKRLSILLLAIYYSYSSNQVDNETTVSRYMRLMDFVNIANCYQLLSFEEKNEGEELFFGINEEGHFTQNELDRISFLVYSAYLQSGNDEWKKIRLKGLETRIKDLPVLEKFRVLNEVKKGMEFFSSILYDDNYILSDLNDFYFDVYRDSLKSELRRVNYNEILNFYDEFQSVPYLGLTSLLTDSLTNLSSFLSAYPDLTREQVNHFLLLFKGMPQNKECIEMIDYLTLLNKEAELNEDYTQFRTDFLNRCHELLPEEKKREYPKPNVNDLLSTKAQFAEKVDFYISTLKGDTSLSYDIDVKTRESSFEEIHTKENSTYHQEGEIENRPKLNQTIVYVHLNYQMSNYQSFKIKINAESDVEITLPQIDFIAAEINPEVEDDATLLISSKPVPLKKSLFKRTPSASFEVLCAPLPYGKRLFVQLNDQYGPVQIRTIHNQK